MRRFNIFEWIHLYAQCGKTYWATYILRCQELLGLGHPCREAPSAVFVLMLVPEEVWSSAVTVSTEHW